MQESANTVIDEQEYKKRVALLKKFRETLLLQREKFRNYLRILEQEEKVLEKGEIDKLETHIELERAVVSEIYTIQRVIDPLEKMYRELKVNRGGEEIPKLRLSLERIKNEVIERNGRNQTLIKEKMQHLREEILSLRIPQRKNSLYSNTEPSLVDITT